MLTGRARIGVVGLALLVGGCASVDRPDASVSAPSRSTDLPLAFTVVDRFSVSSLDVTRMIGMAVGPDGKVYVIDVPSQQVVVISPRGAVIHRWGSLGRGPGQFRFFSETPDIVGKVAVDKSGRVYVLDPGQSRVEVFTPRGDFETEFGGTGTEKGNLWFPIDLAVDAAGDAFVEDQVGLSKFSPDGEILWRVDARKLGGTVLLGGFDAHGRLVGKARDDVLYIDEQGGIVDRFAYDGCCVVVDPAGNTYVMGWSGDRVDVLDRAHRLVARWSDPEHPISGWAIGPNGEAFIFDPTTIFRLDLTMDGG
jgi:sugar lactone lactonase YvrE